jgi:uncharacterized protein
MATPLQAGRISVQIVCLAEGINFNKNMLVPVGQCVAWALNASGLYGKFPHLKNATVGLWGKKVNPTTVLAADDRIEVYTPVHAAAVQRARVIKRQKPVR